MNTTKLEAVLEKEHLILLPRVDSDYEEFKDLSLNLIRSMAPELHEWYLDHLDQHKEEFVMSNVPYTLGYSIKTKDTLELVGFGQIHTNTDEEHTNAVELSSLYVYRNYHGKGIGREFLEAFIQESKKERFDSMILLTRVEFRRAVDLYEKKGFYQIENTRYSSENSVMYKLDL